MNPPVGDPSRQATKVLQAFTYQLWQSVHAWINLGDNEVLYLEVAEDYDRVSPESTTLVQVKDQEGLITLGQKKVREALKHFWEHRSRNPEVLHYHFLTRSSRGFERGYPFGELPGLDVWDHCKEPNTDPTPLREFLLSQTDLPRDLLDFIGNAEDEELRHQLLQPVVWLTDSEDWETVKEEVRQSLINHGRGMSPLLPAFTSEKALSFLYQHLSETALRLAPQDRRLTRTDFHDVFERATLKVVPASEGAGPAGTHASTRVQIIEVTPDTIQSLSSFRIERNKYLESLITIIQEEEDYSDFPDVKLCHFLNPQKDESSVETWTLEEVLAQARSFIVFGRPGAGKSSALKKLLLHLATNALGDEAAPLPVYFDHYGKDLFEQLRDTLHAHGLVKDHTLISETWLRNALLRGQFVCLIDDVHNLVSADAALRHSRLTDLLQYHSSRFVLMSRDYVDVTANRFGLPGFEVLPVEFDEAQAILKLFCEESEAFNLLLTVWKSSWRDLYRTPQMLRMVATIYNARPRFDIFQNKLSLFENYLELRHKNESTKTAHTLPLELKHGVLGALAYNMLTEAASDYLLPSNTCRQRLREAISSLAEDLGFDINVQYAIQNLFKEGYLVQHGNTVKFEHDQWVEFFCARELLVRRKSISALVSKHAQKEVALFIGGAYTPREARDHHPYWSQFWRDLVLLDFFAAQTTLDAREAVTGNEWQAVFEGLTIDEKDLREGYTELLNLYRIISAHHFPALRSLFAPRTTGDIGVVVAKNQKGHGYWYGYRGLGPGEDRVVLFDGTVEGGNHEDARRKQSQLFRQYGVAVSDQHAYGTTPNHDPPAILAFRDAKNQLAQIVTRGHLPETEEMRYERLYFEAAAFSTKIQRSQSFNRIYPSDMLAAVVLLVCLQRLKAHPYNTSVVIEGGDYHDGLRERRVTAEAFEADLLDYLQSKPHLFQNKLQELYPGLHEVLERNRWLDKNLEEQDREFLLATTKPFLEKVYSCYKSLIEQCFPTSTNSFTTYRHFPLQIIIMDERPSRNSKYLGKVTFYRNVPNQADSIQVNIVDEKRYKELEQELHNHAWLESGWYVSSFRIVEPLRNAVYRLIRSDLKETLGWSF